MAGVPFRTAHEVVAEAAAGLGPEEDAPDYEALSGLAEDVLGEPLSTYVDRDALEAALDPTESVAMRDSRGGPAPDAVAEQVSVAVDALAADREVLADRRQAVSQAADRRQTEVDRYVERPPSPAGQLYHNSDIQLRDMADIGL